ncbi:MAG TPA: hypothetical protein VF171_06880 [Trueperaceae bacterium]
MNAEPTSLDEAIYALYAQQRPDLIDVMRGLLAAGWDHETCYQHALQAGTHPRLAGDVRRIARHLRATQPTQGEDAPPLRPPEAAE